MAEDQQETPQTAPNNTAANPADSGASAAANGNSSSAIPTVYFIDDSATMREVVKIAFRRESMKVVTCNDAASAMAQFAQVAPDVVITDVIMPDTDGYEVCRNIKQNAKLRQTPVILMSGVVNRTVAEKAISAQADELIRKPFQPQELIARVKNLLQRKAGSSATAPVSETEAAPRAVARTENENGRVVTQALSGIFAAPASQASAPPSAFVRQVSVSQKTVAPSASATPRTSAGLGNSGTGDVQKLRIEIQRLEMLVKKLQLELQAERQYSASLEEHLKTLQEAD